ncbi:MAG TPA: MASE1 domain-containing protein [Verrucomicrobiae bacterium]|nr:MASE1 domain-containing protein [Verrucomicrobiae bacterium]
MDEDAKRVGAAPPFWGVSRGVVSDLAKITALALVYFVAGKLGLKLAFLNQSATAVWPPTGIALAAVLLLGYRVWPGIWLGAFLVNITTAGSIATTICIAGGNTLEVLLGVWFVQRFAGGWHAFDRARGIFQFVLFAAGLSTMVSATIGVTSLALGGFARWENYAAIWTTWWLGDAVSALTLTPLIIVWSKTPVRQWDYQRISEAALVFGVAVAISVIGFGEPLAASVNRYPRFLLYPAVLWAAYRFGQRGAITTAVAISGIAIWGTLRGFGPFASGDANDSLVMLQIYISTLTVTNLVLGAAISERRVAEDALRESQERTQIAQQATRWGIFDYNNVTEKNYWSPEIEALYGLQPGDFEGTYEGWHKRIHPEDWTRVDEEMNRALNEGEFSQDFRVVWPDGSVHWLFSRARVFQDSHGQPLRILGVNVDITERKQAEEAQARLAAIVESSDDAILGKNLSGIITSWNAAAEKLYGYIAEEAIGKSVSILIPPGHRDEEPRILAKLGRGERIHRHEAVHITKDGRRIDVSVTISPVRDTAGKIIGGSRITRDITERKRVETELKAWRQELESRVEERTLELVAAHKQLQAQIEERKRLEAEMARAIEREQLRLGQELHDGLGQQLAGISYMMNALQTKLESALAPVTRDAEKVEKLILASVEQVRHLAKGFYPVELERHGLLFALEEIARTTEQIFGVRCVLQPDESSGVDCKDTSAIQLFRIAQEAVHNAVKHAGAKQITIRLAAVNGDKVLSVMDDGIGLPSGGDNEPKGMGLRIMQYRARMIGGTLDVRNNVDGGAIVTCSFPAAKQPATSDPQPPVETVEREVPS